MADDDFDALLDGALDTYDKKQKEHQEKTLQQQQEKAVEQGGMPGTDELLGVVQQLLQALTSQPNFDPHMSKTEEERLMKVVNEGISALQTPEGGPGGSEEAETKALLESISVLKGVLEKSKGANAPGPADETMVPPPPPDPELQAKIDELLSSLAGPFGAMPSAPGQPQQAPPPPSGPNADAMLEQEANAIAQMLSSEMVSRPFAALRDVYPVWMEKYGASVPPEELRRVKDQQAAVTELCGIYENDPLFKPRAADAAPDAPPTEADTKKAQDSLERVLQLVQRMQEYGEPPQTLLDILEERRKDAAADQIPPPPPPMDDNIPPPPPPL